MTTAYFAHTAAMAALGVLVIVVVARLLGAVACRLGQPRVIGEIAGGILLGPSLFGGVHTAWLFPADARPLLASLATIGVCVFMFFVGMQVDHGLMRGQARIAASVSLAAIIVPFGLGALLALHLLDGHSTENRTGLVLFVGLAMSVTAFPVLARILSDRNLLQSPIGALALACAALGDAVAWAVLACVAAMCGAQGHAWTVALAIPFAVMLLCIGRPLLANLALRVDLRGRGASAAAFVVVTGGLALSAIATDRIGLHAIFGAFLFGVAMPRVGATVLRHRILPQLERASAVVLLPVFFLTAGLNVDLSAVGTSGIGDLGWILLVANGGKLCGGFLGARVQGVAVRGATLLAVLVNARGLTELIVLTIGLQLHILDAELFSLMVVMAVVTTALTGVLLRVLELVSATPLMAVAEGAQSVSSPQALLQDQQS